MAPKYLVETYGCQMNFHDSERIAGLLEQAGYEPALDESEADVVVINTCSVREHAEDKLYTRLGQLRRPAAGRGAPIVAVTGCVAQQEHESLLHRSPSIDVVVGTQALKRLPGLIGEAREARSRVIDVNPYEDVSFPLGLTRRNDPVKAYITIIEGCNDFCSFCVVPYTRGHERMRPLGEIVREVEHAVATGHPEVHLLGQIVNHYVAPDVENVDFAGLVERLHEVAGVRRIRFASPHPRHVTRRLIEVIRDLSHVCKHIHLPVQSGSTAVLQAMRRRHSREWYLRLIGELREAVPNLAISTDMIVGFPGETEAQFEETLSLVREARFSGMFSFKYSPRPNTLALKRMRDDVPEEEKTRRIVALQALQREIQLSAHQAIVGSTVEVLVDSVSRRRGEELSGRTSGNTVVNFPGSGTALGSFVNVLIERAGPNSVWGQIERANS